MYCLVLVVAWQAMCCQTMVVHCHGALSRGGRVRVGQGKGSGQHTYTLSTRSASNIRWF